ncbi:MAG: Loki-CTERM sorting domain-containing protein [Promethearchaeota archaeon]
MKLANKLVMPLVLVLLSLPINVGATYWLKDSFEESKVVNNEFWYFNLGSSTASYKLDIDITSERSIDVLFMDDENYYKYDFGSNFTYFAGASQLDITFMDVVYTTTPQIAYFLVIDNTDNVPNGASYTGSTNVTVKVISTRVDGGSPTIPGYPILFLGVFTGVAVIITYKKKK